jgi:hypothetical protein
VTHVWCRISVIVLLLPCVTAGRLSAQRRPPSASPEPATVGAATPRSQFRSPETGERVPITNGGGGSCVPRCATTRVPGPLLSPPLSFLFQAPGHPDVRRLPVTIDACAIDWTHAASHGSQYDDPWTPTPSGASQLLDPTRLTFTNGNRQLWFQRSVSGKDYIPSECFSVAPPH